LPRIALIGYGAIGQAVREAFCSASRQEDIVGVLVRESKIAALAQKNIPAFGRLEEMLALKPDVVAETAGQEAARDYAPAVLEAGCDLLITSIGVLVDDAFFAAMRAKALANGCRLLLPSGAVGGMDALVAMRRAGLTSVTYRSRKPPPAWKGSIAETMVNLDQLQGPAMFYRGSAREAARGFPKNANVAATVALAGLGMDNTRVELFADPTVDCNVHEIEAIGVSGRIALRMEGRAFPDNPRSSMLTAFSVADALMNTDRMLSI
jgi:aspartate dehydrogenase